MKKLARIGGMIVGIGAGIVAGLWLLKDKIAGPPQTTVEPEDAPKFRVAPPPPETPAPAAEEPDDLTSVKGIGPVFSARLAEAGISTFAGLAAATAAAIAEKVGARESQVEDWIAQAADLAS